MRSDFTSNNFTSNVHFHDIVKPRKVFIHTVEVVFVYTTAGEPALVTTLWGMLYADDAGVVSQSPEQLRNIMRVIVVVCAAFSLIVSEAKTETMCIRTKGMPEAAATFSVKGTSTTTPTCSSKSTGEYATHGAAYFDVRAV